MKNKYLTLIATGIIIVVGVLISTMLSNQKEPMRKRPVTNSATQIKMIEVENQDFPTQFEITGRLRALDKVELFAEVSGILLNSAKRFKEGNRFKKGEVLIKIDDAVYKNNVLAQKSGLLNQITLLLPDLSIDFPESAAKWENYLHNFDLEKSLAPLPEPSSDQERFYVASRNIYNQFYQIKSMEETLAKYTIEAPYDGVITQSNINPGTLVRNGQKLGEFTNTSVLELQASVGIDEVNYLKIGDTVILTSEDIPGKFQGRIQRINEVLDQATQTVKVYIITTDPRLRDGMYMSAIVDSEPIENAFRLAKNLLVQDEKVFALEESTLVLKKVSVVKEETDHILVTGLNNGTRVLGEPITDAREGMKIESGPNLVNKIRGEHGTAN